MPLRPTEEEARTSPIGRNWISARVLPLVQRHRDVTLRRKGSNELVEDISNDQDVAETRSGGQPPIKLISFLIIVAIPFFACLYYFIFTASDQYISEARFAVRSLADQGKTDSADSTVLSMSAAGQDAYVVTSFIQSSELLRRIEQTLDVRGMFARDDADWLSRSDKSEPTEEFLKYWKDQVTAYIDGPSGIVTLKVRTFRPDDSQKLASAIVTQSEELINELNQRSQRDMVASIKGEVERTGKAYADSLTALNRFQLDSGLLSPEVQAQETGKLLTGLLGQKLELETRMFVMKQSAAENSPAYEQLSRADSSLDAQVEKLRAQLTGPENASIARAILGYSKLETDRLVAEKLYEAARSNYDSALAASMRKALYLTVFVHPTMPEESLYPKRISTPLIIGLGLLVFWMTLMLLKASVDDHRM